MQTRSDPSAPLDAPHDPRDPLIGESEPMRRLRRRIALFATADAPVLLRGETGSGKELTARAVHRASPRRQRPFVAVNCGAFPGELVEAELFGSLPGGYTGARQRDGLFVRAHRGTLFLDELGELPLSAQAVLLRVLETGEIRPVGGDRVRAVDVRVVCATHRDLPTMVAEGHFRADLFHRLATLGIEIPPLRARLDDLRPLALALVKTAARRLTDDGWRRLEAHRWPGNVRELRNVLIRASAEHPRGPLTAERLHFDKAPDATPDAAAGRITADPIEPLLPLDTQLARYVRDAVRRCEGNVRAAARALEISPTTVYRYLALGGAT